MRYAIVPVDATQDMTSTVCDSCDLRTPYVVSFRKMALAAPSPLDDADLINRIAEKLICYGEFSTLGAAPNARTAQRAARAAITAIIGDGE